MDNLLYTVQQIYTKGTKYSLAHADSKSAIVSNPDKFVRDGEDVWESTGNVKKNGHSFTEAMYHYGKWGKILNRDLLDIAKEVYLPGTRVKAIYGGDIEFTIKSEPYYDITRGNRYIMVKSEEDLRCDPAIWSAEKGWAILIYPMEINFSFNN